jgi:hypothetical protein
VERAGAAERWFKRAVFSFGGSLLFFQEDYGFEAAPSPILPAPFFSFAVPPLDAGFAGIALETTLDMYFTHYKYSEDLDRPITAEIENRSAFVFAPVLAFQAQGRFKAGKAEFRVAAGIAGDLRIVLLAGDMNEADMEDAGRQTEAIRDFFSRPERALYYVADIGADFRLAPKWLAGLDIRVWAPIDFSGFDRRFLGWRFGAGFRASAVND